LKDAKFQQNTQNVMFDKNRKKAVEFRSVIYFTRDYFLLFGRQKKLFTLCTLSI